jgi:hypothetical protein
VIKEAADPEANIIFGTVIDDRMRDEVKVTVIATGFDSNRKPKQAGRYGAESAGGVESSLDERSREILAEIERDREQRQALEDQMGADSPFARPTERQATEVRPSERQPVPVRPASLERPSYADTDLDIPSFLRRKND